MQATSETTNTTYENWDALVEAEANGYSIVIIQQHKTKVYARVEGPFKTKREAMNRAAAVRRRAKKDAALRELAHWKLLAVGVEPIWKKLF